MVIKEEVIAYMEKQSYRPMMMQEILRQPQFSKADPIQLKKLLDELEISGDIVKTRYGRYGLPHRMNLLVGRLVGNQAGYAFLLPERPGEDDVYIPANQLKGALHGDRVMIRLTIRGDKEKKREGAVIRILNHANEQIVGSLEMAKEYGFIVPDKKKLGTDFFVAKKALNGAKHGDKVVAKVVKWAEGRRSPEAVIVEILGRAGDVGVDTLSVIRQFGLPEEFPQQVLNAAAKIKQTIDPKDYPERCDLRDTLTVTIDGADARDLDDAVSVSIDAQGHYLLGVHIADVGHFVTQGSVLDKEAFVRGTSVYFPDRVIPMLPKALSNGICSLNPQVIRLALSILMRIDDKGEILDYDIKESLIKTDARLTYDQVNEMLVSKNNELCRQYQEVYPMLQQMADLALILRHKRETRGSIDFDFPESKVIIDEENGRAIDIRPRKRTLADNIIEEFMLKANEAIAQHFYWLNIPFVYRVHEEPMTEKLIDLNRFLHTFGLSIKGTNSGEVHPKAIQEILEDVKGRREENLINTVILRSMKRATYEAKCQGHFGLAARYYTHFTSPIRRYPDLVIHRIIKRTLKQGQSLSEKQRQELEDFVQLAARQSTEREKVADEAERDVIDLKKVEYMESHIGEQFRGLISGVISAGFFVALPNTVEGFVHISSLLDDYYIFDADHYRFIGQRTGKIYRLGDEVDIVVAKADLASRHIDFVLQEMARKNGWFE